MEMKRDDHPRLEIDLGTGVYYPLPSRPSAEEEEEEWRRREMTIPSPLGLPALASGRSSMRGVTCNVPWMSGGRGEQRVPLELWEYRLRQIGTAIVQCEQAAAAERLATDEIEHQSADAEAAPSGHIAWQMTADRFDACNARREAEMRRLAEADARLGEHFEQFARQTAAAQYDAAQSISHFQDLQRGLGDARGADPDERARELYRGRSRHSDDEEDIVRLSDALSVSRDMAQSLLAENVGDIEMAVQNHFEQQDMQKQRMTSFIPKKAGSETKKKKNKKKRKAASAVPTCSVCREAYGPAKTMVAPACGHALCGDCACKISECPLCRKTFGDLRKVFMNWQ